ncbi:hypothetical protein PINS_up003995 [Pythium insidiosum]|nr:hypothetical protein PINS_up003995 [Pythium insidiosum]
MQPEPPVSPFQRQHPQLQLQRTRHASLDFPRSSAKHMTQEDEWCEFLSASMVALTADDDDDDDDENNNREPDVTSRSFDTLSGLSFGRRSSWLERDNNNSGSSNNGNSISSAPRSGPLPRGNSDDATFGSVGSGKIRGESFSETLTSSTGSSPGGSMWRPLGRRASAHSMPSSNQIDHQFELAALAQASSSTLSGGLSHLGGFQDVVNISSSGSSAHDSTSSDEDTRERHVDNNIAEKDAVRPAIIDVDPAYAASCLPMLAALPESGRELTVDTRPSGIMHVKSPVLSNRKDAQTWQLQEEELLSSPRFGGFRGSIDETTLSMLGGRMSMVEEEATNQPPELDEHRQRTTKDARAASVDFTHSRPNSISPPLPPPQEPMQRLRARSFSYSSTYGSSSYNPVFSGKPYAPQPPPQDFPTTMRQFHAGPPPPPPQPASMPHTSVRPPRVSIPADSPMHPYHQPPANPPFRRYSTDFAAHSPYPESMPHDGEHRTPTGRGMRSYSVDYFSPNTRLRTHSVENHAMFSPPPPPVDYPGMARHASGGPAFEWPRSPLAVPTAPPLPPDTHSPNAGRFPPPPPEAFYEVEFKRGRTEVFAGNAGFNAGEYVKVEADRGEDIGKVVRRVNDMSKLSGSPGSLESGTSSDDSMMRPKRHDAHTKRIVCVASVRECELLSEQRKEEHEVFEVCKSKVRQRLLPMNVIDAEYQFDRHKLTFFFEADRRIDFRELVRDLFAIYKTRIWLQQVVPVGKRSMSDCDSSN